MNTRIIVVGNDEKYKLSIKKMLVSSGYIVIGEAEHHSEILRLIKLRNPDMLIVDGDSNSLQVIELINAIGDDPMSAMMIMTMKLEHLLVERAKAEWFLFYHLKTLPESVILSNLEIALATFIRNMKQEMEITKLRNTLETRKFVDRAKGLLMKQRKIDEQTAFRHIQKISMDQSLTMKDVAKAIIISLSD